MTSKIYIDAQGKCLGVFGDGALPDVAHYVEVTKQPPDGWHTWNGIGWDAPIKKATSYTLKPYQFHALIDDIGKAQDIRQAIMSTYSGSAKHVIMNKLERGTEFERDDDVVMLLSTQLGITPEEIDILWLQAKDY